MLKYSFVSAPTSSYQLLPSQLVGVGLIKKLFFGNQLKIIS